MTDQRFFELSTELNKHRLEALEAQQQLLNRHAYRYMHFVQSSPVGMNCRYAKLTRQALTIENDIPKTRELLTQLIQAAQAQLQTLEKLHG